MFKKLISLFLAVLMLLNAACVLAEDDPVVITDMFGRPVTVPEEVTRIVVMMPADCEILCALGCEDLLVGRGTYCNYPSSISDVPVVESGAETNLEQIISLSPQFVLMSDMAHSVEQVEALENAGIQVVVSAANDLEGVYTAIRMIGTLVSKTAEAEALIGDMQQTFDDIAAKSENTGKTIYFESSPLQWGLWAAGSGTFMDELASICGLNNIFSDVTSWVEVSEEQVLERNPDYIVTTTMYFGEGPLPVEEIMGRAGWENISAVASGNVFNADNDEITRPGPRLKDAAIALYHFINGISEETEPAA